MNESFDEFDNENNNNNIPLDEPTPFDNNASNPLQSSNSQQNKQKTKKQQSSNPFGFSENSDHSDQDSSNSPEKNPFNNSDEDHTIQNEDVYSDEAKTSDSDSESDSDVSKPQKHIMQSILLKIVSKKQDFTNQRKLSHETNANGEIVETDEDISAKRRLKDISVDEILDFTPIYRCVHIYKLLAETTRKNKAVMKQKIKEAKEHEREMKSRNSSTFEAAANSNLEDLRNMSLSTMSLASCVTIVTDDKIEKFEDIDDPNTSVELLKMSMTSETELASLYRRERQRQARILLQIINTRELKNRFAEHYCKFLQRISGFFVIESHLMSTASYLYKARKRKTKYADEERHRKEDEEDDDLMDFSWLSDAWSWACSKVIMLLRNQLAYQDKANVLLETKDLTMARLLHYVLHTIYLQSTSLNIV